MVHQRKWHVVIYGTEPGVYSTWIEAGPKTRNIPGGAIFQSFPSEAEAVRVFEAAKARGEVRAYPDAGTEESTSRSKNAPLSPLGEEASLLRPPLNLKVEVESTVTDLQTPLPSPARSRVAVLRRTLRDSETESYSTSSSPPTEVTTRVYAPLYQDDDDSPNVRPSPYFTFTSSASRAYSAISAERFFEADTKGVSLQLEVSDWDSRPSTSSSSDSPPGADSEEHTPKSTGCMPLRLGPPKKKGVKYASLAELADRQNVDSRVWLPEPRVFNPDKVKPRPLTRPSSIVKRDTFSVSSHNSVDSSSSLRRERLFMDSPFVKVYRGRRSRLAPTLSLPIFSDRDFEVEYSGSESSSTQPQEDHRTGKGKEREPDYSMRDERPSDPSASYASSPRNDSRSHVQLVPRGGRDERSAIMIHCPPNCPHETRYTSPPVAPGIGPSLSTGSRYVDASVSPIITMTGRIQNTDSLTKSPTESPTKSPTKSPSSRPRINFEGDGLAVFTHVPHQGIAPEADVRSPISKGTMVPMIAAETPFGRPSPSVRVSGLQINQGNI